MHTTSTPAARRTTASSDTRAQSTIPFPVFICSIARLLVHLGYQEVTIKKPLHSTGKGRNSLGGVDIEAYQEDGLTRTRVIAQLKQHLHSVPRSSVDELRGAMLRHGALKGLLFTAGTFSPSARLAAQYASHTLPVRLVDGAELIRLLKAQEVPIRADNSRMEPEPPRPTPDRVAQPTASDCKRKTPGKGAPPAQSCTPGVTITLIIGGKEEKTERPHSACR